MVVGQNVSLMVTVHMPYLCLGGILSGCQQIQPNQYFKWIFILQHSTLVDMSNILRIYLFCYIRPSGLEPEIKSYIIGNVEYYPFTILNPNSWFRPYFTQP